MSEQGQVFTEFVHRELGEERERRKTFDTRGVAVVTTSASLLTLLSAVAALAARQPGFMLPSAAEVLLFVTLFLFAATTLCGIMVTIPWSYQAPHRATLAAMTTERWATSEVDARNYVARSELKTLESLRTGNTRKGLWLLIALLVQLLALISLTATIGILLATGQ